jgi:hypothetical protein
VMKVCAAKIIFESKEMILISNDCQLVNHLHKSRGV